MRKKMVWQSKMVKNPYPQHWLKMNFGVGQQLQITAEAIKAYRLHHHLTRLQFAEMVNAYAERYGSRLTYADVYGYETYRITPKIDKLTAMCRATGLSYAYFAGYNPSELDNSHLDPYWADIFSDKAA